MRYQILIPNAPVDLKELRPSTTAALHAIMPPHVELDDEHGAVKFVRKLHPGAVAMLFLVSIGSGTVPMCGILDEDKQRRAFDENAPISFSLVVIPIAENDHDRMTMRRRPGDVFDRATWRVPPERPDLYKRHSIELRSAGLEVPLFTDMLVGRDSNGRLVCYLDLGETSMSLHFDDKLISLIDTHMAAKTA